MVRSPLSPPSRCKGNAVSCPPREGPAGEKGLVSTVVLQKGKRCFGRVPNPRLPFAFHARHPRPTAGAVVENDPRIRSLLVGSSYLDEAQARTPNSPSPRHPSLGPCSSVDPNIRLLRYLTTGPKSTHSNFWKWSFGSEPTLPSPSLVAAQSMGGEVNRTAAAVDLPACLQQD